MTTANFGLNVGTPRKAWRGTIIQYAGRLHRLHDMKKEVIIRDYADLKVPVLEKMYLRRSKGYKAIGYKIEE